MTRNLDLDLRSSIPSRARLRPVDDEGTAYEYGAYGHGPHGAELAERLVGHIRTWDRDHRAGPGPVLTVHPADTPDDALPPGHVLHKRHGTMVLSWPEAEHPGGTGLLLAGTWRGL